MQKNKTTNERFANGVRLGKAPARGDGRLLHMANFADLTKEPPIKTNFWPKRAPFPTRSFGNLDLGDCTRAKQAWAMMRMERLETKQTPTITDEEVIRAYFQMTEELYGSGDTGAYEIDALSAWRKPDKTIRDTKNRPLTIDAFTRINHANIVEVKNALALSGAHGIAVCFNLPFNWAENPQGPWDVPENQMPIGPFLPGSWGGHSMWAIDYTEKGVVLDSTWNFAPGLISWRAFSLYCDEAYMVFDSLDAWRKKPAAKKVDFDGIKKAVNKVSSYKIK